MGSPKAQVYLSSPYVAAATAIAGVIASPEVVAP
jgi:homoaconitase/3-isopropylmalate dehydratase large subunit